MRGFVMALALAGVAGPAAAEAPVWTMIDGESSLAFTGSQNGAEVEGTFQDFTAEIRFADDQLETSMVRVEVDVASIDLGGDEREEIVRGSAWFHVEDFPRAVFLAEGFEATDAGYRALGTLALKGFEQEVPVTFDIALDGERAVAEGTAELLRTAFGVGPEGAVFGVSVAPEVAIRFRIVATRAE